jgi:LysM repeat protein
MPHDEHLRTSIRLIVVVAVLIALAGILLPFSAPVTAQESNLLQNPGFEGTYVAIGGDSTKQLAPSWQPWHLPPPPGSPSSVNLEPDYQVAPRSRVRSGQAAQEYNTFFATHEGGIFQRAPVTPGVNLRFSAHIYVWSSATFEDPDQSIQPQGVKVSVGIDPNGGTDPTSDAIVWSTPVEYYDEYREISITAPAPGNSVTVYVRSKAEGAIGVNNVYVDDAALVVAGPSDVTPETPTEETPTQVTPTTPAPRPTTATSTPTPIVIIVTATPSTGQPTTTPQRTPFSAEFPNELVHIVQAGNTVSQLAVRYGSTIDAIIAYNGLSSNGLIFIGQRLLIPVRAGQGTPVIPPTPVPTPVPGGGQGSGGLVEPGVYVVQQGDTLFRIALRFNTTVDALARYNNILNPNRIFVGQRILIPTAGSAPVPAQPIPGTGGPYIGVGGAVHIVRAGENIFRIGLLYNVTWDRIARANGLFNPNLIFVGQRLIIPR